MICSLCALTLLWLQQAPTTGQGWFQQGLAQHTAGQYDQAIASFTRAIDLQFNIPGATMRIARAHAGKGDAGAALEWLDRAAAMRPSNPSFVESDADFQALRRHPGFAAVLQKMQQNARPCAFQPDYKRFEFWIGEWEVFHSSGRKMADSRIESTLDGCVIVENWMPLGAAPGQGSGKSWNVYDGKGKWRQTYVTDFGEISEFEGRFQDPAMVFFREFTRGGKTMRVRMTFTPLEGKRVRQLIEQSADGGATWNPQFDGEYRPKS